MDRLQGYLFKFVSIRPRSLKEIHDWFARKKVDEEIRTQLLTKLKKLGFVDDTAFAKWWVEQRSTFRHKSSREIAFELAKKGVDKKVTQEAIKEVGVDDFEMAKKLMVKLSSRWKGLPKELATKKKVALLSRRGFPWEVARRVLGLEGEV